MFALIAVAGWRGYSPTGGRKRSGQSKYTDRISNFTTRRRRMTAVVDDHGLGFNGLMVDGLL